MKLSLRLIQALQHAQDVEEAVLREIRETGFSNNLRPFAQRSPGVVRWRDAEAAWLVTGDVAYEEDHSAGCPPISVSEADQTLGSEIMRKAKWWRARFIGTVEPGKHVHACPICYESPLCTYTCHVEPDLGITSAGLPYGSYAPCESCGTGIVNCADHG